MTAPIRYGVVGTGMMGVEHLRNLLITPGAEVVAVVDPTPASLGWATTALGDRAEGVARFDSVTIPDYANGSADWSVGAGGAFGTCLASLTGTGAAITPAWTTDARCTNMGDSTSGTWWDDVPDGPLDPDAQVGSLASGATDGVASFRFGLRVAANQAPGRYLAPITFQVLAP